jgi:hypothetical protein
MHPAFLYVPDARLSLSELTAARIDGHLVEVGDVYIPADLIEGCDVRAAGVAALVRTGTAASGPTAAWIHGARDSAPSPHHLRRAVARRIRPPQSPRIVYHDTPLPDEDVESIGGVLVSTAARTLFDLSVGLHRDPTLLPWIRGLADVAPALVPVVIRRVRDSRRLPGSRAALSVLERTSVRTT